VSCAPVVDAGWRKHPLLPAPPVEIISNASFNSVPIIAGLNPNEGLLFYLSNELSSVIISIPHSRDPERESRIRILSEDQQLVLKDRWAVPSSLINTNPRLIN